MVGGTVACLSSIRSAAPLQLLLMMVEGEEHVVMLSFPHAYAE